MSQQYNSAYRIFDVMKAATQHHGMPALHVYARVFWIRTDDAKQRSFQVLSMLSQLHGEIVKVRKQLRSTSITPAIYNKTYDIVEAAIPVEALNNSWDGYRKSINTELLLLLQLFSELLPDEGVPLDHETLEALEIELDEIEAVLANSTLPGHLVSLIASHIELIRRAIREYRVVGPTAFTRAADEVQPDLDDHLEELREYEAASPEVSRMGRLWAFVNGAGRTGEKGVKLLEAGNTIAEFTSNVFKVL